jgi:hypothetical protein
MHPTTVSQEFALVAVITLSISVVINLYRVLFPARRRKSREYLVATRSALRCAFDAAVRLCRLAIPRKRAKTVIGVANS